uniref:Saposin B-type domain-containing protein n=1 Tax=Macrostomum lignano TaxID=282301 RepID=A0A1I8GHM1_9PLAT
LTASGSTPSCSSGQGFWCSSNAAARRCGAVDFCRQPRAPPDAASSACSLCRAALGDAKRAVLAGQPESEIAQLLKSHLPRDQLAEETLEAVKSLIETYLAEAVRALRSGAEPSQLCALLALCNQTAVDAATRPSATPAKLTAHPVLQLMQLQASSKSAITPQKPLSQVGCQRCHKLVAAARQLVRDDRPQAEVSKLLRCSNAIDKYLSIIFELLSTELDPTIVCQTLGACQQPPQQQPPLPSPPTTTRRPEAARAGSQCHLCGFVIRGVERRLGTSRSKAAIVAALNEVCSALSQPARPKCDSLVQRSAPLMARLLSNGARPGLVCSTAGLCSDDRRPQPPAKWILAYQRAARGQRSAAAVHSRDLL